MTFFRYPGGKSKFQKQIKDHILENHYEFATPKFEQYRELFFGGGSVGLDLKLVESDSWINDKDIGLWCLWTSVRDYPEELCDHVSNYQPKVQDFYDFKDSLKNIASIPEEKSQIVLIGFRKLAIHQISYSGLGTMSGSPLGGKLQKSAYPIDCRWSPSYLVKNIAIASKSLKNTKITCVDYSELILDTTKSAFLYIDPPYYEKGSQLYQHSFNEDHHKHLANLLQNTSHQWLLSYDDCDYIRNLYSWAKIKTLNANYSISGATKKSELLIYRG